MTIIQELISKDNTRQQAIDIVKFMIENIQEGSNIETELSNYDLDMSHKTELQQYLERT